MKRRCRTCSHRSSLETHPSLSSLQGVLGASCPEAVVWHFQPAAYVNEAAMSSGDFG